MQDKELYQHILGLTSPWTVRERSLGGTLATPTATNAMQQMGSQYQPDAPVRESTSVIPPPKTPCWRGGLVLHGKPRLSRGWECGRFGLFERHELDQLAKSTITIRVCTGSTQIRLQLSNSLFFRVFRFNNPNDFLRFLFCKR
jgi:hypothetical protein